MTVWTKLALFGLDNQRLTTETTSKDNLNVYLIDIDTYPSQCFSSGGLELPELDIQYLWLSAVVRSC